MPHPKLREPAYSLALSIRSTYVMLADCSERDAPAAISLRWVASELERLASEAYRLADESEDDPCAGPIPGFDTPKETP